MGNKKTPKLCSYTAQTLDYHLLLVCVFMGTDTWCDTWVQCFNTVCFSLHVAVDFWSSTKIETPEHFWQLQCVKARASGCEAKHVCTIKVLLSHRLFVFHIWFGTLSCPCEPWLDESQLLHQNFHVFQMWCCSFLLAFLFVWKTIHRFVREENKTFFFLP